jgi:hypothetical protein
MKKSMLFLLVFITFAMNCISQNESNSDSSKVGKKKCCFKMASLSVDLGVNKYRVIKHDDYESEDPSYSQKTGPFGFVMNNNDGNILSKHELTLELGLNPYNKKLGEYNKKQELAIGLFYSGSNLADWHSIESTNSPGDTFSNNSTVYQNDTVMRTQHAERIAANVLGISVKYLFKTDPEKRFSLYSGIGINASFTITSQIYEKFQYDTAVMVNFYNTNPNLERFDNGLFLGGAEEKTSMKAESSIFTSVYIPFGVNFRLAKNKKIWNQMNIFLQGSFGLEVETEVKGATSINPFMGCSAGFKFEFE